MVSGWWFVQWFNYEPQTRQRSRNDTQGFRHSNTGGTFTGGGAPGISFAHHAFSAEFDQSKPVKIPGRSPSWNGSIRTRGSSSTPRMPTAKSRAVAVRDGRAERVAAGRLVEERYQSRHTGDHQRIHGTRRAARSATHSRSGCLMAEICLRPRRSKTPQPASSRLERRGSHVKKHVVVIGAAVVAATSALLTLQLSRRSVGGGAAEQRRPKLQNVSQRAAAIKRLPDGTPDIRGTWVRVGGGMNEANAPDSELKAFGVLSEPQGFGQGLVTAGPEGGLAQAQAAEVPAEPASAARDRRSGEPAAAVHARRRAPSGWTTPRTCAARRRASATWS